MKEMDKMHYTSTDVDGCKGRQIVDFGEFSDGFSLDHISPLELIGGWLCANVVCRNS